MLLSDIVVMIDVSFLRGFSYMGVFMVAWDGLGEFLCGFADSAFFYGFCIFYGLCFLVDFVVFVGGCALL